MEHGPWYVVQGLVVWGVIVWAFVAIVRKGMEVPPETPRTYTLPVEFFPHLALQFERELALRIAANDTMLDVITETPPDWRAIHFKPSEPETFDTFTGQSHIITPLRYAVQALAPHERVITHRLLTGLPGLGKTLIAKVLGHELQLRAQSLGQPTLPFIETFAANLETTKDMDAVVRELLTTGGAVWFIDELHVLDKEKATKLYSLLEEGRYPFHGELQPTPVPDVCVIGATTDYGGLHGALKRRFGEPMMVRKMTGEELQHVVLSGAFPIDGPAVSAIVSRTQWSGAPWEALSLRREALTFAKAHGSTRIREADVAEVCKVFEIDDFGLRWIDRQVMHVLFHRPRYRGKSKELVCYAASEADLCSTSGLDPEEYRTTVKPRLLSRGLLEVRSGYGQALTSTALTHPVYSKMPA